MGEKRSLYMGIDILEGSPLSRTRRPLYAVAIIDGEGRLVASQSGVPLSRVIRLAWDYRPQKIAVDNVFELAASRKELERVLSLFPPESAVVLVTMDSQGVLTRVRDLAREHGLPAKGKLSPQKTAYLLALLASMGEGTVVRQVEEKTIIVVSRARSPGKGGQSQRRLQRRVRASVHLAAMRIKEALDRAGLDYDFSYRESVGGLESAVFIVYAPRSKLYGIVRPHRGQDFNVTVKPVYKTRLLVATGEPGDRPLIVGVDPGITTGLAVLDLAGRVLYLSSGRDLDRGRILEILSGLGKPVVVAVDVRKPPEAARKLAAQLGAWIYSPPEDLSTSEKRDLAQRALGRPVTDSHQRDALAAAYKAFLGLRGKLEHVEREIERLGIDVDPDVIKASVVRGATIAQALEEAIEARLSQAEARERLVQEEKRQRERPGEGVESLIGRIEELTAENRLLSEKIEALSRELEEARREVERAWREARSEALRDPMIRKLQDRITVLERELEEARKKAAALEDEARRLVETIIAVARGDLVLLRSLPSLTWRNLRRSIESLGPLREGEIVYVESASSIDEELLAELAKAGVLGLVYPGTPPRAARRLLLPIVHPDRVPGGIVRARGLYLAGRGLVELLRAERRRLEEERIASFSLERLVEEYRRARMREAGRR